jgi:hypothetical protein
LVSLALVAGLTLMNVQAAELHVHATADHVDDAHHHGPASHQHDVIDHHSSEMTQVSGVDADDTVVQVSLVASAAKSIKPVHGDYAGALMFVPRVESVIDGARIIARAHGPPSVLQHSLRAPPALLSL